MISLSGSFFAFLALLALFALFAWVAWLDMGKCPHCGKKKTDWTEEKWERYLNK